MSQVVAIASTLLTAQKGVRHAFFTRQGGVSQGVYASFNQGLGSGDESGHVLQNRRRAAAYFEIEAGALLTGHQVHSALTLSVDRPWSSRPPEGDALVTATPGLACGALASDCAPVLIADAQARVVAAVHAGWKGALGGVVASAVEAMRALGADPARMAAAVESTSSPSSNPSTVV